MAVQVAAAVVRIGKVLAAMLEEATAAEKALMVLAEHMANVLLKDRIERPGVQERASAVREAVVVVPASMMIWRVEEGAKEVAVVRT